tara:strand:- start:615 stop:1166 length:552 start_codon:yes stop_codon:yes gene_type:complete
MAQTLINNLSYSTLDATKLSGSLPAISGASLTGISGGKVLQVTQSKITGERGTNSTSYIASNIHHNITPSATSSKVLVMFNLPSLYCSLVTRPIRLKLYRHTAVVTTGGSPLGEEINGDFYSNYIGGTDGQSGKSAFVELDSPSSTSAVYYQIYFSTTNSDNNAYIGQGSVPIANVNLLEIGA